MGLELLSKVFPFKVRHKPGYRMRVRVGIDSGPCTAGIIGDKLPHYSVFGETVEIAGVMEASSEPMKIQVCPGWPICFGKELCFTKFEVAFSCTFSL